MTFTNVGRLVAWALTGMGILLIAKGFYLATSLDDPTQIQRYSSEENTGQLIDKGMYYVLFGIAFGVLTYISRLIAKLYSKS